jgi:hypothetical protein
MIEWPPIEKLALGALAVMPSGRLRASLPSDVLDRAARAGISREQIQSALGRAVRDAAQDALAASLTSAVADMLRDMQQYGVAINASGALRRVDPQAASVFASALTSAVGYYANFVAVPYSARTGTAVTPQPSLNTLRDVYYWSRQILLDKGYSEEDAGRMAVFPVVLVYVAAAAEPGRRVLRALPQRDDRGRAVQREDAGRARARQGDLRRHSGGARQGHRAGGHGHHACLGVREG